LTDLAALSLEVAGCRACPRLVAWREHVACEKRAAFRDHAYWGRPVPGFGPRPRQHEPGKTTWFDDNGWWGLAFLDAYNATGNGRYLSDAEIAQNFISVSGWDTTPGRPGGLWWNTNHSFYAGESLAGGTLLSAKLYAITQIGTPVILARGHTDPASVADPGPILGTTAREEIEAKIGGKPIPSLSPNAVMSILVSRGDMKIYVLQNAEIVAQIRAGQASTGDGTGNRAHVARDSVVETEPSSAVASRAKREGGTPTF
jgi:hypothetical protein